MQARDKSRYYIFSTLSFVSAVLAMKTKENAFTPLLVITLYEFLFFFGPIGKRILRLIALLTTLFIIPITSIMLSGQIQFAESMGFTAIRRGDYFFTQLRVVVTYIRLLVLPVNQSIDHGFPIYN